MNAHAERGTYIIDEHGSAYVKIGAATDVTQRISQLQIGNPRKLNLLFWLPNVDIEKKLQNKFNMLQVNHGRDKEWFHHAKIIDEFIKDCQTYPATKLVEDIQVEDSDSDETAFDIIVVGQDPHAPHPEDIQAVRDIVHKLEKENGIASYEDFYNVVDGTKLSHDEIEKILKILREEKEFE
jgi:hypothetical protein